MGLTDEDFDRIARLAGLRPTADEKRKLLSDINKILEYLEIIDEADIEGVEKMLQTAPREALFSEDIVRAGRSGDDATLNTTSNRDELLIASKAIENPGLLK